MKKLTQTLRNIWKDESAQGATEYILLLVIVVALAVMFKDKIREIVSTKLEELGTSVGGFNGQ